MLRDLRDRGLRCPAKLLVGDGALGLWAGVAEIWPETRAGRCWNHKIIDGGPITRPIGKEAA